MFKFSNFPLPTFQAELDQIAAELSERQECSELSRKRLIEQSKEFKKSAAAETKKQVAVLLRNFQNEVGFHLNGLYYRN